MSDAQRLRDLAARVEALTGPDREADALIHEAIGLPLPVLASSTTVDGVQTGLVVSGRLPKRYTASVDAALTLVPKGCYWRVNSYAEALVFDAYERARDGSALPGPGDVARALTAAALLAVATTTHPQETGDGE